MGMSPFFVLLVQEETQQAKQTALVRLESETDRGHLLSSGVVRISDMEGSLQQLTPGL